jgi:AcrR family transcriptional regulator
MIKRTYNLGRRAETSAETRQRLVEATAALHGERGISGTSLRDIAERAGVSVGTAYHHFPTYLDAVSACGKHTMANAPLPTETIFDGIDGIEERLQVFIRELCAWYERNSWFEHIRAERGAYPPVEEAMAAFERGVEQLAKAAARCTADEARTIAALADASVHSSLLRAGVPARRIPGRIADIAIAWLRSRSTRHAETPARHETKRRRPS